MLALAAVAAVAAQQGQPAPSGPDVSSAPAEAAAFRLLRHQDENGDIPNGALWRAKAQADAMRVAARFQPDAAGITRTSWTWLGPSNIGGRIRTIAIHPTSTSTIFIGSIGGGIWKSTNSGASWAAIDDFMANLAVSSLAINPVTPSTMYAGTGEGFYNYGRLRGAGILKSSERRQHLGAAWRHRRHRLPLRQSANGARPDVESGYATAPYAYRAGWGYLMLTWGLWNQGNGTFTLYAFAYDREGRSSSLGSKVITSNNATATRPFGGIDTPGYGATISGGAWNYGWALTPNVTPSCTITASGVQVAIDSGPLLPVNYGDSRPDIAAAFPGFTNGSGGGGSYFIDTTTLANGTHQIGWFVTDNCGRADGIGSRFFNVLNANTSTAAAAAPRARSVAQPRMETLGFDRLAAEEPVEVRRGLESALVFPGGMGDRIASIAQGERVEVRLPALDGSRYAGYQVVNGERRPLPLGSSLDAAGGIFYWQPAAGFLGVHDLHFVAASGGVVRVRAVVGTGVQAAIDVPADGTTVNSPFVVAGWAVDLAAATGSGVDTVHVWAYPASGAAPIFLGVAHYGDTRPDIGWLFGDQFSPASYSLPVLQLAPGDYNLVVYPHSAVLGDFQGARVVRVRVQ